MGLSVAYKSQQLLTGVPEDNPGIEKCCKTVKPKQDKQKSIYTIMREERFRKAALKKYADRIAAIQKVFPDWQPSILNNKR